MLFFILIWVLSLNITTDSFILVSILIWVLKLNVTTDYLCYSSVLIWVLSLNINTESFMLFFYTNLSNFAEFNSSF